MSYKVCFVCTGNACRSPFAECVTKQLLADAEMSGFEVWSMGTLNWGKNPRDAAMVAVAKEMGYEMGGTTTVMTREQLMEADVVMVFEQRHRDAITRVLDYSHWDRIVLFNQKVWNESSEVIDPHYQSDAVYRQVAQRIEAGCRRLVGQWQQEPPL
ncbi:MAG: hypothetical protein ACI30R_10320 [Sodaliphilus sp.]